METYNKEDLISMYQTVKAEDGEKVSDRQAKSDVDSVLVAITKIFESAKEEVPNKKGVRARLQLVNFGSFEMRHVKERAHRNPQDPEAPPKVKPAHNKVVYGTGKYFEEVIN